VLPDPELSVKEKLGLAGPFLPLDRFYDERFRRLHKLAIISMRPNELMKPTATGPEPQLNVLSYLLSGEKFGYSSRGLSLFR
jgi:hypothetical protein